MVGPILEQSCKLMSLRDILVYIGEDEYLSALRAEEQEELTVWVDESEVDDPEGITFAYLTPSDIEMMRKSEMN